MKKFIITMMMLTIAMTTVGCTIRAGSDIDETVETEAGGTETVEEVETKMTEEKETEIDETETIEKVKTIEMTTGIEETIEKTTENIAKKTKENFQ